jgi:hypothetical protein
VLGLHQYGLNVNSYVLIRTEEFAIDLGNGFCWGKTTIPCLLEVTDVFQLKNILAEVQSCCAPERILFSCSALCC